MYQMHRRWRRGSPALLVLAGLLVAPALSAQTETMLSRNATAADITELRWSSEDVSLSAAQMQQGYVAPKSAGTAFLLSFLVPGVGQFYNGDYAIGGVQLTLAVVGTSLMLGTWYDCWEDDVDCGEWTAGAIVAIGSRLWSMIDAPMGANRFNRRNGLALAIRPEVTLARSGIDRETRALLALPASAQLNVAIGRVSF